MNVSLIMSSINRVILIGHLGAEPESRVFADGTPVCNLRIATTDRWRDRTTGEQRESTEWHRVVLFRRQAEVALQYLHKGSHVYIEGRLRTRKWTDKSGVDRYSTDIEAEEMKMLGKRVEPTMEARPAQPTPVGMMGYDPIDDTIPF